MIPTGGLSVFIHLTINVVSWTARRIGAFEKFVRLIRIPAPVFGIVLTSVIVYFAGSLLLNALRDSNNLDHMAFILQTCEEISIIPKETSVIIRVDDIQAYAWTDVSERIIDDAIARDIPLSLAVIPKDLRDDPSFYTYLRSKRCTLEFALHGWDNLEPEPTVGEFAHLTKDEALERLRKGVEVIDRLSRDKVYTFVPPLNHMSTSTREALQEMNIPLVSLAGNDRFDFDATTFDFNTKQLTTLEEILATCDTAFSRGETECVVMVHPQDFVTNNELDPKKYSLYIDMLDAFQKKGYTFTRFKDYISTTI